VPRRQSQALDKEVKEAAEQRKEEAAAYQELLASDGAAKDRFFKLYIYILIIIILFLFFII